MARVFVGVGSNLGDRKDNIQKARTCVETLERVEILRVSPVYETEPQGGPPQGKYYNAVWEIETKLAPDQLLERFLTIERQLGRERGERNRPRTIDLDILFYDDKIVHAEDLKIPHPRLHERVFVLRPMADLEPSWVHPVLQETMESLLEALHERNTKS